MTIKITGLELRKDTTKIKSTPTEETRTLIGLEGELELEVSHGQFKGQDFYNLSKVSEELKNKLYDVLIDIEKELENKEPIKIKEGKYYETNGKINFEEATVKLPKGEYIIPKDEADRFFESTKVIDSLLDVTAPLFGKITKEQLEMVEKLIPTVTVNISDKETNDTIADLLNKMKSKSGLF